MLKFVLYLLESGICLSVLFALYLLFFKKETYFTFNRYYLLAIISLSLIIPLIHVNIRLKERLSIGPTIVEIGKFRNYYESFVVQSDPDFAGWSDHGLPRAVFEGQWENLNQNQPSYLDNTSIFNDGEKSNINPSYKWGILYWLLILYAVGVIFFTVRFIILLSRLLWQLTNHRIVERLGLKIVLIPEEVPPFSFFRYVFMHEKMVDHPEFEQILAHERVHIFQSHSTDLLIVQALVIFQWFNPLVWQVQKAIKINHEFIADRKVVNSGFELFDYQALLLSQLISIRSVELVNNFNLISIKKRITMLSTIKSGFHAKLKALVIIPVTVLLLFLFTDMTISSPNLKFSNYSAITFRMNQPVLKGIWKSEAINSEYSLVSFEGNKISILDNNNSVRNYDVDINTNHLILYLNPYQTVKVPIKTSGNLLTVWWTPEESVKYRKTAFTNSLDLYLSQTHQKISLPEISHFQILERPELVINVILGKNYFEVDGVKGQLNEFEHLIKNAKDNRNVLDHPFLIVNLSIDKEVSMGKVYSIYQVLRKNRMLKIGYAGYANNNKVPALLQHAASIPKLLPPPNTKYLTKEEEATQKAEGRIIEFSAADKSADQAFITKLVNRFKKQNKLIMKLTYKDDTPYGQYLSYTDAAYVAIYKVRDEMAMKKHGVPFNELSSSLQLEIRKHYPMMLTEYNMDQD